MVSDTAWPTIVFKLKQKNRQNSGVFTAMQHSFEANEMLPVLASYISSIAKPKKQTSHTKHGYI